MALKDQMLQEARPRGQRIYKPGQLIFAGRAGKLNLITDPGFNVPGAWQADAGWSVANGVAIAATGVGVSLLQTAKPLVVGHRYLFRFTIRTQTAGSVRPVIIGGAGANGTLRSAVGRYEEILIGPSAVGDLGLRTSGTGFAGTVDELAVFYLGPA